MTNYFELYGLPERFSPDQAEVRKKFYALSRQYHPDHFTKDGGTKLEEAMKMSAQINEAYRILKNPDATMNYVLQIRNVLGEKEKYQLPPEFLMEIMNLNEAVSEYEMEQTEEKKNLALGNLRLLSEAINSKLKNLTARFDNGEQDENLLSEIKEYYFRKKYLKRIEDRVNVS